jgi:hypothetical protein
MVVAHVMNPYIVRPNVNSVQASVVSSTDGHIIDFAVGARVHGKVEGGRVDKNEIVNGEMCDLVQAQQARSGIVVLSMASAGSC